MELIYDYRIKKSLEGNGDTIDPIVMTGVYKIF